MHEIDLQLLRDAGEIIKNIKHNCSENTKVKIIKALADYTLAVKLSNGPDLKRSKYWANVAEERRVKVVSLLNRTVTKSGAK